MEKTESTLYLFCPVYKKIDIIENREYDFGELNEFIEYYIQENKKNKENCIKNGIKYFEIIENYEIEIENIYKWIGGEINKK
jgi:hypothetical protein